MRAELISGQLKDSMGQSSTQSRVSECVILHLHNETWGLIYKMYIFTVTFIWWCKSEQVSKHILWLRLFIHETFSLAYYCCFVLLVLFVLFTCLFSFHVCHCWVWFQALGSQCCGGLWAEQTHSDELKHYRVLGIVDKVQYCVSILKLHCDRYYIQHNKMWIFLMNSSLKLKQSLYLLLKLCHI